MIFREIDKYEKNIFAKFSNLLELKLLSEQNFEIKYPMRMRVGFLNFGG